MEPVGLDSLLPGLPSDPTGWSHLTLRFDHFQCHQIGDADWIVSTYKDVKIVVALVDAKDGHVLSADPLALTADLLYADDRTPVPTVQGKGPPIVGQTEATIGPSGTATFLLRLAVFSSEHAKRRFRVAIRPADPLLAAQHPKLTLIGEPLKSVTKLPIARRPRAPTCPAALASPPPAPAPPGPASAGKRRERASSAPRERFAPAERPAERPALPTAQTAPRLLADSQPPQRDPAEAAPPPSSLLEADLLSMRADKAELCHAIAAQRTALDKLAAEKDELVKRLKAATAAHGGPPGGPPAVPPHGAPAPGLAQPAPARTTSVTSVGSVEMREHVDSLDEDAAKQLMMEQLLEEQGSEEEEWADAAPPSFATPQPSEEDWMATILSSDGSTESEDSLPSL